MAYFLHFKIYAKGQIHYDSIHNSYLKSVSFQSRKKINFKFKKDFSGYIKIVLKEKLNGGAISKNMGEFIIDARHLNLKDFTFNLAGHSLAEVLANSLYNYLHPDDLEIFVALSFDDRIYDELRQVQ